MVERAAGALRGLGVGRGDVVAVQLPNWWEFVVTALACGRIGAVVNPLMPIFRERELSYMLGFGDVKVLVVPKLFRGFDHEAMAEGMRAGLPKLEHVIVVDGAGENGFARRLLQGSERVLPAKTPGRVGAPARRPRGADVHLGDDRLAEGGDAHLEHADRLPQFAFGPVRPATSTTSCMSPRRWDT